MDYLREYSSEDQPSIQDPVGMDSLPFLALHHLAQYLSPADLAACCAVSRAWRTIFDVDDFWWKHSDPSLRETLEATSPTIEQAFADVSCCDGKLAFMRQNYLFNNWRNGWFEQKQVELDHEASVDVVMAVKFIRDDLLAVAFRKSGVELWNVSGEPKRISESMYKLGKFLEDPGWLDYKISGDYIGLCSCNSVELLRFDEASQAFHTKHLIVPDDMQRIGEIEFDPTMTTLHTANLCNSWCDQWILMEGFFLNINSSQGENFVDILNLYSDEKVQIQLPQADFRSYSIKQPFKWLEYCSEKGVIVEICMGYWRAYFVNPEAQTIEDISERYYSPKGVSFEYSNKDSSNENNVGFDEMSRSNCVRIINYQTGEVLYEDKGAPDAYFDSNGFLIYRLEGDRHYRMFNVETRAISKLRSEEFWMFITIHCNMKSAVFRRNIQWCDLSEEAKHAFCSFSSDSLFRMNSTCLVGVVVSSSARRKQLLKVIHFW